MNIKFVIDIDPDKKTGLYNAVEAKINYWGGGEIFNISYYDSISLSIIKKIFKKRPDQKKELDKFANSKVENIFLKKGVLHLLARFSGALQSYLYKKESIKLKSALGNTPSLISAHWAITAGILCHYATLNTQHKYVITCHGSDIHTFPHMNKFLMNETVTALENAEGCIFISERLKQQAEDLGYSAHNAKIIYNGIDTSHFKKTMKNLENKKIIGFVGNLYKVKGADIFARICARLANVCKEFEYIVVGDGDLKDYMAETIPKDKVTFMGTIAPDCIPDVMSGISLLVVPSRNEGLGLVALEALAAKIKVITSDVGGLPEAVGEENTVPFSDDDVFEKRMVDKILYEIDSNKTLSLSEKFDINVTRRFEIEYFNNIRNKSLT